MAKTPGQTVAGDETDAVVETTDVGNAGKPWYAGVPRYAWIVLGISALGWLFDTMDQNIFTLVRQSAVSSLLPHVAKMPAPDLAAFNKLVSAQSGVMTAIFLVGWSVGGLLFGMLGDRLGRTRTMMITILIYALFTGLSGLSHTVWQFGLFRFLTALGVGGEWAAGAAIVAETFPPRARAHALGLLQALSAVGNMLAAVVTLAIPLLLAHFSVGGENWRWAFAVGALPALLVLWIRSHVHEPEQWQQTHDEAKRTQRTSELGNMGQLFSNPALRRNIIGATLMAAAGVGGFWGVGNWTPELTKVVLASRHLTEAQLGQYKSYVFLIQNAGAFFGAYSYAVLAERTTRRGALLLFFMLAFGAIQGMFQLAHSFLALMVWAPFLGFCLLGPFSAYTVYFPELFPTRLRTTGCGFAYNCARILAAIAPLTLGSLAAAHGFRNAASMVACVYALGLFGLAITPETKGKPLPD